VTKKKKNLRALDLPLLDKLGSPALVVNAGFGLEEGVEGWVDGEDGGCCAILGEEGGEAF
jgi:hypothetical protein